MTEITIKIPGTVEITDFELNMILASRLFEGGKLSSGQAAEMVGLSKRAFIEMLGKFGVSVFGYSEVEMLADLKNL
jgi:predicted HTH domain antitoxin